MGFGGEYGNSRAARADGAGVWAWNRRIKQLARMKCDLGARTTALGTADAATWVNRQEYCLTQPRATMNIGMSTGPCGRPAAEAAARRRGPLPYRTTISGQVRGVRPGFELHTQRAKNIDKGAI